MEKFKTIIGSLVAGILVASVFWVIYFNKESELIETTDIQHFEKMTGLEFTDAERDSMLQGVRENVEGFQELRDLKIENSVWPSLLFNPLLPGMEFEKTQYSIDWKLPTDVRVPEDRTELAFMTVAELSVLMQSRQITSMELTLMFLDRLKKYGPQLENVITLTEDLALEQARRADEEISVGINRGLLHGIPYGSKDLLALEGYPTTWGATPYKDQVINETATVIKKLEAAGAVHLAKLTLGALAWGDVWFGGMTRTPWNLEVGASGSSAGSSSAMAAGLVAFAIGSETLGSIVSPATRNGVSGLRPTYGRVSRHGAMALSWSMDKLGPITRSAEDAAIVFNYIYGPDGKDPSVYNIPFNYNPDFDFANLRVGYVEAAFEADYPGKANDTAVLEILRGLGANLVPIRLPEFPTGAVSVMLDVESAAAFEQLTLSNQDDQMVRQIRNAWPNVFRTARTVPAVEYIQASRARTLLQYEMHEAIKDVDVYVVPSYGGGNLTITNLTGHPCVVVPNGFNERGLPTSITFMGHLFDEGKVLALARAFQNVTDFHKQIPEFARN
ncbi:MAG TPA: amidase [Bacteroidetes bacterium]|nr:amidase [Bacteroidota bacterium]